MKRLLFVLSLAIVIASLIWQPCRASEISMEQRKLFREGAKLWPVYCAQCHNARPGSQFAPYQWDAILMHMRTQANLPSQNARAILEYLKAGH
jgi:mono/diheme cytochrome c family protein